MIRAVVFDLGGVACRFRPERRLRALARLTGFDEDEIDAAVWRSGLDGRAERGALSPAENLAMVLGALQERVTPLDLRAAWATAFEPDEYVCDMAARMPVPTALFTNNGPMVSECLAHELAAVARCFDATICSWQLGTVKPREDAFRRLLTRLDVRADEVVLVDDSPRNTAAAAALGIAAVTFTGTEDLGARLGELGVS